MNSPIHDTAVAHPSRRPLLLTASLLLAVALALVAPGPVARAAPDAGSTGARNLVSEAGRCPLLSVRGRAAGGGHRLSRDHVALFLTGRDRPLAAAVTSRQGRFRLSTCRTRTLARYARRHAGRVNLTLLAHERGHGGSFFARVVTRRYVGARRVHVPARFTRARTVPGSGHRGSADGSGGGAARSTGALDVSAQVVHPPLMFVQAVRHMTAHYTMSSDTVRAITAMVGVSRGGYGAAGSVSLAGEAGFATTRTLRASARHPRRARLVRPELSMTGRYFCPHYNPYSGGFNVKGERHCVVEAQGEWTGRIETSRTDYVPCTGGPARATYFNNRTTTSHEVHRGAVFTSEVSLSGFGSSLSVSAEYGTATRVRYHYPRSHRRHRFCLGGNASTLARSSRLFVTYVKPRSGGGPDCRDGSGPRRCTRSRA